MTGGEIIRKLRIQKGYSLKELSEKVDVNYVFLSKLERNMDFPSENLIKRLATELGYKGDVSELIASFGKIPETIKQMILEDPSSVVELPAFFKSRRRK